MKNENQHRTPAEDDVIGRKNKKSMKTNTEHQRKMIISAGRRKKNE